MAAFEYRALDPRGRACKGVLTGDSPRHIRSLLRNQGLHPVEVQAMTDRSGGNRSGLFCRPVSAANLALMTRQFATLVRAGMPLEEALRALGGQIYHKQLQSVITGVRAHITEGASLTDALGKFPHVFSDLYRAMVEAGEASGRLDEILERLADYTEEQQYIRQKLGLAMIYPLLLTVVAMLVVTALLIYVVPEVIRVFEQTGQQLPLLTRWLIACSDFLRSKGLWLLGSLTGLVFLWFYLLRLANFRYQWHRLLLKIPLIGNLNRTINAARLSRMLAILTESGVPLLESLRISNQVVRNEPIREALQAAAVSVREGGRLHTALGKTEYFPPLLISMISAGEESGELEKMLERAATHQERELNATVAAVTSLMEPLLILLMGGIVLLIVLAILMPIFEMNQLVGM